jgi:hypothetical protein
LYRQKSFIQIEENKIFMAIKAGQANCELSRKRAAANQRTAGIRGHFPIAGTKKRGTVIGSSFL